MSSLADAWLFASSWKAAALRLACLRRLIIATAASRIRVVARVLPPPHSQLALRRRRVLRHRHRHPILLHNVAPYAAPAVAVTLHTSRPIRLRISFVFVSLSIRLPKGVRNYESRGLECLHVVCSLHSAPAITDRRAQTIDHQPSTSTRTLRTPSAASPHSTKSSVGMRNEWHVPTKKVDTGSIGRYCYIF